MMEQCRHDGVKIPGFHNHSRVAKRRMLAMINAKRKNKRKAAYVDLIKTTGKVVGYAKRAVAAINAMPGADLRVVAISFKSIIMSN
jgi:hypothetical protein